MGLIELGPALIVVLVLLAGGAAVIVASTGLGRASRVLAAAGRAAVQLAVVSAVIVAVLRSAWLTAAFIALMALVAAGTSARRISGSVRPRSWWTLAAVAGGAAPTVGLVLASGAVPREPVAVLPLAGILIGGAMTATTLAGRRMGDELRTARGQYEAALALGLPRRDAVKLVAAPAASVALIPGQDQTRTVGLVTLPGAFVGVLLGGGSAVQAGATQVLVLVGLLLTQSLAAATTVELVARGLLPVVGDTDLPA